MLQNNFFIFFIFFYCGLIYFIYIYTMNNKQTKNFFNMYFSIKAFNGTKRRFENLDNINELNEFVVDWSQKGFTKFVIKSFDENGFRKKRFAILRNEIIQFLDKN